MSSLFFNFYFYLFIASSDSYDPYYSLDTNEEYESFEDYAGTEDGVDKSS